MPNFIIGSGPAQLPRNSDLGQLSKLDMLPFRKLIFTASQTWSPPRPVIANIYVTGGGGSPGANTTTSDGSSGGSGAGTAIKNGVLLLPNVVYTLVIGAGGAQAIAGGSGNAGGDSTFSGVGVPTLTGGGGRAGITMRHNSTAAFGFMQAQGGTASGGDINLRGGCGQAYMGVSPQAIGVAIVGGSTTPVVMAGPGGGSFWGPGASPTSPASNFGEGGGGTGVNGLSQGYAGYQGAIMIEFNE